MRIARWAPRAVALVLVLLVVLSVSACGGGGSGDGGLHKTAPDVVGLTQAEAAARIVDAGYEVGSVSDEQSDSDPGTVIRQDPVAGTSLARGQEINLVLAVE